MRTLQKTLILAGIGALLATGITLVELRQVEGQGSPGNARGWAWGGTEQVFTYGTPPQTVTSPTGLGWISMSSVNTGGSVQYGVDIPQNGDVTGSAWSENIGWIDFQPGGSPPAGNEPSGVRRQGNHLEGWARIRSIAQSAQPGGFAGWIHLRNTPQYEVKINPVPGNPAAGTFEQDNAYAWSDEFGWIDFSGACFDMATCGAPPPPQQPTAEIGVIVNSQFLSVPEYLVAPRTPFRLGWQSVNTADCLVTPGGWNGTVNSILVPGVANDTRYTINCNGIAPGTSATDSILIRVGLTVSCEPRVRGTRRSVVYRTRSNPQARVDWTETLRNGTPPFTYTWTFDPVPTVVPPQQNVNPITVRYGGPPDGEKNAHVSVRDNTGRTGEAACSPVTVQYLDIIEQ